MPDPRSDRWAAENLGFLHVATITAAHGVRGEAKAVAEGHFPSFRLSSQESAHTRYILLPGRRYPRPVSIAPARKASQKGTWILRIAGVHSREHVAALRGARLYVKEQDRPNLNPDEFMVADLVGCRVHTLAEEPHPQQLVGVVETVLMKDDICRASGSGDAAAAVAADLLEVALFHVPDESAPPPADVLGQPDHRFRGDIPEAANRVLVPFVKQVVPHVDLERATITIDPPPGLLDIALVNRKEKRRPPRGLLMSAKY